MKRSFLINVVSHLPFFHHIGNISFTLLLCLAILPNSLWVEKYKRFANIDEIMSAKNDILLIVADGDLNSIQNRLAPYFIQVKRLHYKKRDYLIYLKKRA